MTRFHINKHGVPAPCRAKPGNCPLGDDVSHFASMEEAQAHADRIHKQEFDILPTEIKSVTNRKITVVKKTTVTEEITTVESTSEEKCEPPYRKAQSKADYEYIRLRKEFLKNESDKKTYVERCKSCRRLNNYKPKRSGTRHFNEDRTIKARKLTQRFGEGKVIGHYEINHLVGKVKNNKYRKQIAELRDNGRLTIYDKNTGKIVTTFMAHRSRVEAMMIMSNEIPSQDFLCSVTTNRDEAAKYKLS